MAATTAKTGLNEPAHLIVEDLSVSYDSVPALQDISFRVPEGSRVAVIGPNGAGKSTLFKTFAGLLPLQKGRIMIHGLPLRHHRDCVAYVPQREEVDWGFPVSVSDVVMMGRYGRLGWFKRPSREDRAAVIRSLEKLGIADLASLPIGSLSGGQQQRVFLARALVQEPHVVLMDEPFTGIDVATQEATLLLFEQLKKEDVTVLISTHDLSLASTRFDLVLLLNRTLIAYGPPAKALTSSVLSATFGGQLLLVDGMAVVDRPVHKSLH